ncbi:MAG: hypothetical protein KDD12_25530 [Lewinella sp.]|nr:hypothetical protein [Lewinella sp.]
MGKHLAFIFLAALFNANLTAQPATLYFQSISEKDGLESGYHYFLKKDSRGFLWISSLKGVFGSDGISLTSWTTADGLLGDNIQSNFEEDSEGNIWFASYNAVNQYRRTSNDFFAFQLCDDLLENYLTEGYQLIQLEKDDNLWLCVDNKIYKYNIPSQAYQPVIRTNSIRFVTSTSSDGAINRIFGFPWMFDSGFELFTKNAEDEWHREALLKKDPLGRSIETVGGLIENDSLTWLFSNKGLIAFSPSNPGNPVFYSLPDQENTYIRNGAVFNKQYLLLLEKDRGPVFFDRYKMTFVAAKDAPVLHLRETNLRGLLIDRDKTLWLAHDKNPSIEYANLDQAPFVAPGIKNNTPSPIITSIVEDTSGDIWCATQKEGVFVFDRNSAFLKKIPYLMDTGKSFNIRYQIICDPSGNIWLTGTESLYVLNPATTRWVEFPIKAGALHHIRFLKKNEFLLSTTQGIYEGCINNGLLEIKENAFEENMKNAFAFIGNARYLYAQTSSHLVAFERTPSAWKRLLPFNSVLLDVWEDSTGKRTWFGTSEGLALWNWGDNQITFPTENSLLHKTGVMSITGDSNGQVWVGTGKGLFSFNAKTDSSFNFRAEDGLPSNSFSIFAALTASDGRIWFGTAKGPVVFDPDKVRPYPYGPPIHIDEFKIDNEPYRGTPVASEAKRINLAHFQNNLSFRLKAVGFYLPEFSTIRYRLKNYEKDWQELENGGTINYHQLPPGAYQLEMVGVNTNGVAGTPKILSLVINPPWWQRWWFRASVILTAISLIYLAFRFYLRRKLREQQRIFERQKALQEERNRIAAELHDDLGAGLSIIRFLSDDTLQKEEPGAFRQNISRIYHSAGELLEKMSDIIWAMNADNDTLANLVAHLQGYAYEYLDINRLLCRFEVPESLPDLPLSGAQRRNVLLSVKEALHNIVKHAEASEVDLTLSVQPDLLRIIIQDNGSGIDLHHLRTGGNGVRNIRRRMEAVGGSVDFKTNAGTIVTLSLPVSL